MAKLNKNMIIQLLTDEVERLKAVNEDQNDMLDRMYDVQRDLGQLNDELYRREMVLTDVNDQLHRECNQLIDQKDNLRDELRNQPHYAENDYYSVENIAIRRAEEAERKLARAHISLYELEMLMTPCSITGKKIEPIKLVRQITGAGLRESKELVEDFDRAYKNRIEQIQQDLENRSHDEPQDLGSILASALK